MSRDGEVARIAELLIEDERGGGWLGLAERLYAAGLRSSLDVYLLAKALHRVITLDPNSGGDFDTAPHTEAAWSGYAEDIAAEYERLIQEPAQGGVLSLIRARNGC